MAHCDLILDCEHVLDLTIVTLGPTMRASFGIVQLRGDAYPITHAASATLQHVAHAKFAADLTDIKRPALILKT